MRKRKYTYLWAVATQTNEICTGHIARTKKEIMSNLGFNGITQSFHRLIRCRIVRIRAEIVGGNQ